MGSFLQLIFSICAKRKNKIKKYANQWNLLNEKTIPLVI
jgi:hypothetical protein